MDDSGNLKGVVRALVAQWIERSPAKAEVVGSNPAKRAIFSTGCGRFSCGCGVVGNRAGLYTDRRCI